MLRYIHTYSHVHTFTHKAHIPVPASESFTSRSPSIITMGVLGRLCVFVGVDGAVELMFGFPVSGSGFLRPSPGTVAAKEFAVCVCVYLCVCVCVCRHLQLFEHYYIIYIYYKHTHTYMHVCVCVYIYICIYIHIYILHLFTATHTHVPALA